MTLVNSKWKISGRSAILSSAIIIIKFTKFYKRGDESIGAWKSCYYKMHHVQPKRFHPFSKNMQFGLVNQQFKCLTYFLLTISSHCKNYIKVYKNNLTLYILSSVSIISILLSKNLLRCQQREFFPHSWDFIVGDHFLYSCKLNVWFKVIF